jgi:GAF domain-containing protein
VSDEVVVSFHYPVEEANRLWDFREGGPFLANTRSEIASFFDPFVETFGVESVAVAPMQLEGRTLGLVFAANKPGGFSQDDARLLSLFAGQAGAVIQNARLLSTTQRQLEELSILHAVAVAGAEATNEDALIERVTDVIGEALYSDNFGVLLLDEAAGALQPHSSYRGATQETMATKVPLGAGISGTVAATGRSWRVPDVTQEPKYIPANPGMRSELSVPLRVGEQLIGVINAESARLDAFSPQDERLLTTVAGQLATAIERVRLFEAERDQRELAEALCDVGATLGATLDFDGLLDQMLEQIERVVPYDAANLMLVEEGRARVTRMRGYEKFGVGVWEATQGLSFEIAETPNLRWMAETGRPLVISETEADPNWLHLEVAAHIASWAGAPVVVQGKLLAFFSLDKVEPGFYQPAHAERLTGFAGQAALALQNARLFEESMRQMRELAGLYQTALATGSVLESDVLLRRLYEQVDKLIAPETFAVLLYDAEAEEVEIALALEDGHFVPEMVSGSRLPVDEVGLTGWVIRTRQPLLVGDMERDPLPAKPRHLTQPARSWLSVPLIARERLIGVVSVQSFRPHAFDEADRRFLEALAGQVAIALENARLFEAARRQAAELGALVEISSALRAARTSEEMLPIVLQQATRAVGGSSGSIFLSDPNTGDLVARSWHPPDESLLGLRHRLGEGITGRVGATGEVYVAEDLACDSQAIIQPEEAKRLASVGSHISLPLRTQDQIIGVMGIGMSERHAFTQDEIRLLTAVAEIAGNALHRATVLETLEQRVQKRTRELERANERLRELDRLKSDFVSNVSHELRTPITNILLYLELLDRPDRADKRSTYMSILRDESDRLARLIEDLLTLSRIEQGGMPLDLRPYRLDTLVSEVLAAHEARARAKKITFVHEPNPHLPDIWLSREQMVQVLANLVANAVAYSPPGVRVSLSSRLGERRGDSFVALRVHNEGSAIPPEELPHVFERFYRGKMARESGEPGTGLGLAICKEIVERHQGWMEIESGERQGTAFTVWLPVSPPVA